MLIAIFQIKSIKFLQIFSKKMKKIHVIFCVIFLMILLTNCAANSDYVLIDNGKQKVRVNIEVADDNSERMRGLMFREKLDDNSGMLFIFDHEDYRTFWMKNTLVPLDIIFISKQHEIVDIKYATPCREDPCKHYPSSKPAKYVLEVNGNFTTNNNIKIGDQIQLNNKYINNP